MSKIILTLSIDEANAILGVLGDLPTKTGTFPLLIKIKQQADAQVKSSKNSLADPSDLGELRSDN